jgi:aspartate carbamoyltransferase catalytic subunit
MASLLKGKDFISTRGLPKKEIEFLLHSSDEMLGVLKKNETLDVLKGKTVVSLFFSPSLRTNSFFLSASHHLNANVINYGHLDAAELFKEETLFHASRILSVVGDIMVIRHPRDGSAALAAEAASIPVINAGDGGNQHPATAFSYFFELWKKKKLNGEIALVGNLRESRTVHSLLYLLSHYDVSIDLVSTQDQKLPSCMLNEIRDSVKIKESSSFNPAGKSVVYATRMQKIVSIQDLFSVSSDVLLLRKRRSDEEVSEYALNSIAVRMALLKELAGD